MQRPRRSRTTACKRRPPASARASLRLPGAPETSTVGMPVARPPPYSPGRAVFPHPVLRLYALPRCTAEPSGTHAPTWNLRHTRTRSLDAVEAVGQRLPRVAPRLASPPVEPLKRTVHGPMAEAGARARVPAHARGVVVAAQSRLQPLAAGPPRQMPGLFAPCRAPLARGWERLACPAPPDARHPVPLWGPDTRASPQGAAPRRAGVHTAAPAPMGVLWGPLEVAVRHPGGPPSPKPCRGLLPAAGPHPVLRLAAPPGVAPTAWLHAFLNPSVQGLVPLDSGADGRDRTALGRPRLGMAALALRVHQTCLQPCAPQVEQGPRGEAHAPPVHAPRLGQRLAAACESRVSQGALPSVLAGAGAGAERRQRPPVRRASRHDTPDRPAHRWRGTASRRPVAPVSLPGRACLGAVPCRWLAAWHRGGPLWPGRALSAPAAPLPRGGRAGWRPRRLRARAPPHWPPLSAGPARRRAPARPPRLGPAPEPGGAWQLWLCGLSPAGRGAAGPPVRPCPAAVACAGSVLPSRPAPWSGLAPPRRPLRAKTPQP